MSSRSSRKRGRIALVGFMATGKTSFAKILARRLGWAFVDCDALITRREGRSITRIFARDGEAYFRRLERRALLSALKRKRAVIATGGGVVLDPANRRALRSASFVVWMRSPIGAILKRTSIQKGRPLLEVPDRARVVKKMYKSRAPYYAACADAGVRTVAREDLEKRAVPFLIKHGFVPRRKNG